MERTRVIFRCLGKTEIQLRSNDSRMPTMGKVGRKEKRANKER